MATGVSIWSKTAANNASADSAVNWAEGQAPSSVNDSARAMMASVAKWRDDISGTVTTGGIATAYTVSSNQGFATAAAMSGAMLCFIPNVDSGTAPTLAVDGLTARAINISTGVAVPSGALKTGTPYLVTYIHATTEFILQGILSANPLTGVDIIGAAALTAPAADDSLGIYDLSATTNKKISAADFLKVVGSLTADTAPDVTNDVVLTYDASASAAKKVALKNIPVAYPPGFMFGLTLANGTDATNDINIAAGNCRDAANTQNITLSAITKQLDSSWAAGTNAGGRSSASLADGTWHVFAIDKADGSAPDVLFHTAVDPTSVLPTDYTVYRRLGSALRVSGAILAFSQDGDEFLLSVPITFSGQNIGSTATLLSIGSPAGIKTRARLRVSSSATASSSNSLLLISSPDEADNAAAGTNGDLLASQNYTQAGNVIVRTNTAQQVRLRSVTATMTISGGMYGWFDARGRTG